MKTAQGRDGNSHGMVKADPRITAEQKTLECEKGGLLLEKDEISIPQCS